MTKLNLKTKSLYIGVWTYENESQSYWNVFVFGSNASDKELEKHFRNAVYKKEYGQKLAKDVPVDIFELRQALDYSKDESRIIHIV